MNDQIANIQIYYKLVGGIGRQGPTYVRWKMAVLPSTIWEELATLLHWSSACMSNPTYTTCTPAYKVGWGHPLMFCLPCFGVACSVFPQLPDSHTFILFYLHVVEICVLISTCNYRVEIFIHSGGSENRGSLIFLA